MIEKVSRILHMADESRTSAIAFICIDYNMIYSVVQAAEKTNTPTIVMLLPEHAYKNRTINLSGHLAAAQECIQSVKVPVGVHLDHSYSFAPVMKAIRTGFTSIMIDGSTKSFEENVELTRKVTEVAHLFSVDVEAELGHVGDAAALNDGASDLYTDPDMAERFCRYTEIDSLTIAIGNGHGVYETTPHLDMKRLEEINAATNVPLVLHGGSGIPDEQLAVAFRKGINKFNVGTEFLDQYFHAVAEFTEHRKNISNPLHVLDMASFCQERLEKYLVEKLKLSHF